MLVLLWIVGVGFGFAGVALYREEEMTPKIFFGVVLWPFTLIWFLIEKKIGREKIESIFIENRLNKKNR